MTASAGTDAASTAAAVTADLSEHIEIKKRRQ